MAGEQKQNFTGRHLVNLRLTGSGSEKDTRHHEIAIDGVPATYLPGDALGVHPRNNPELVDRVIYVIDVAGGDKIPRKGGPGTCESDLLVINKKDLAPHVGASLEVMTRDAESQRGARPLLVTSMRDPADRALLARWVLHQVRQPVSA